MNTLIKMTILYMFIMGVLYFFIQYQDKDETNEYNDLMDKSKIE